MTQTFDEPAASPALLLLGGRTDPMSERGVDCPGDLPAASDPDLVERARAAKEALGDRVFILGHHYQRDEVIQFADVTGDSFKLARDAANRPEAEFIVFCGVHFMAESADILTSDDQAVILPDMAAGCSMADMAGINQVEDAWAQLEEAGVAARTVPAHLHELDRRHQGVLRPPRRRRVHLLQRRGGAAVGLRPGGRRRRRRQGAVPARPAPGSQHRRACSWASASTTASCGIPRKPLGGNTPEALAAARMILWKGHCSVHGRFRKDNVDALRERRARHQHPGAPRVHPRGRHERRLRGLDRVHHQRARRGGARHRVGDRHRAQSGAPPRRMPTPTSRCTSSKTPCASARP